jgi:hypothetical protein
MMGNAMMKSTVAANQGVPSNIDAPAESEQAWFGVAAVISGRGRKASRYDTMVIVSLVAQR